MDAGGVTDLLRIIFMTNGKWPDEILNETEGRKAFALAAAWKHKEEMMKGPANQAAALASLFKKG
ncbi:hypothetical protein [Bacillus sp. FJAT-45350]|uniref:hypothetical protein n=1 Tax=Bacillus sp. FJAT-45350 TaxID=2011014 RepID=UPI000BB6D6B4|nr:hypothetical protein [Bacillus sp. FJAT-45350]